MVDYPGKDFSPLGPHATLALLQTSLMHIRLAEPSACKIQLRTELDLLRDTMAHFGKRWDTGGKCSARML
jgi:hypothetical protein